MFKQEIKSRFCIHGKLVLALLFLCLFVPKAKADTTSNFQLYRQKQLLMAGLLAGSNYGNLAPAVNNENQVELTTRVQQIGLHPTDTFTFHFHHDGSPAGMIQCLVLRDSSGRDIWEFNSKWDGPWITFAGATLIAKMQERGLNNSTIQFCFFEKENKPVSHTVEKDGSHIYYSDPDPPAEFLFAVKCMIMEK